LLGVLHTLGGDATPQVCRLGWHVVERDGRLMVPGTRLRRFSTDLATGSAGVLLAAWTVVGGGAEHLLDALLPA
jgi:hypothetical protein